MQIDRTCCWLLLLVPPSVLLLTNRFGVPRCAGLGCALLGVQDQVNALVTENTALHDQLSKANVRLANAAAASRVAATAVTTDADRARFQVRLSLAAMPVPYRVQDSALALGRNAQHCFSTAKQQ
jgi:hypothetical protein